VRGIADLVIIDDDNFTARVIDYKTGNDKYPDRPAHPYVADGLRALPHIKRVQSALLFVVKNP